MPINSDLIKALYLKYAPDKNAAGQVAFVNKNYTSQDKFVEDFYKKYDIELTPEIKLFINRNFGGFDPVADPTIDVDDYDVPMSSEGAAVVEENKLPDDWWTMVNDKFKDISYFDEKSREKRIYINNQGQAVTRTEKYYDFYEDLKISEGDHKANIENEHKKLIDPHAYNLSEWEIEKLNDIRRELISQGFEGEILEKALFEESQKLVLDNYKQQYIDNFISDKVNRYISDRADLFSVKKPSLKVGPASLKDQVNPTFTPLRETPDYDKFEELEGIVFKDIKKFQEVSEKFSKDYEQNQELGKEILAYRERASQPGFEFDANEAVAMQKKLALYNANQRVLSEVIPKIQLAAKDIRTLGAAKNLLGKNYDLLNKNMATTVLGFGDLGLGALRLISSATNIPGSFSMGAIPLPDTWMWAEEKAAFMDNLSLKWENFKTGIKNSYKPDIKFDDAFKSIENFGEFAAQEISTQIPIFTTMIASGGIAGWLGRGLGVTTKATTKI